MIRLLFLVFFGLWLTSALGQSATYFLPPETGAALLNQCSRTTPIADDFWVVNQDQVADLEKRLDRFLKSKQSKTKLLPLKKYGRQYIGFTRNGSRYIYGHYYRTDLISLKNQATEPVVVCDGGSAFWGAVYSVKPRALVDLQVNGDA